MNFFAKFLDAIFPLRCVGCGAGAGDRESAALCGACFARIRIAETLFRNPRHQEVSCAMGAAARYDDRRVRAAIHALKFGLVRAAAEPLAELLVRYALRFPTRFGTTGVPTGAGGLRPIAIAPIVTAVPLHPSRERARGFNQAALIAARFAARLHLEFMPRLIARVRATSPQSETGGREARAANVRGCFAPGSDAPSASSTVILVDDVITSGATCREAAEALRAGGASAVIALAVARA